MMCEGAVVEKNAIYYMKKIIIVLIMSLVLNYLFQERKLNDANGSNYSSYVPVGWKLYD